MQAKLFDRFLQREVSAEILPMKDCCTEDINSRWLTAFQKRYFDREHDADSWFWSPSATPLDLLTNRAELKSFALFVGEKVLGILFLHEALRPSRIRSHDLLVYVDYLATVPWNRRNKLGPGRIRGVGTTLVAWSRQVSRDVGCGGRLGLHSLRSSDGFYRSLGFQSLGIDPARRGMNYFELSVPSDTD